MTLSGIQYTLVTGVYRNADGTVMAGTVRFTPSQTYVHVASNTVIVPRTVGAILRYGALSISLPSTNDVGLLPTNWHYQVVEDFPGGREFDMQLPTSLLGNTVDLSDFVPIALVPPDQQGTIVGPPGPAGPVGPPGTLPVQIGGVSPTNPAILVWYEIL